MNARQSDIGEHTLSAVDDIVWPALPGRDGAMLLSVLFQLEQSQWWPADKLRAHQFGQIEKLCRFARSNIPYLAARLDAAGNVKAYLYTAVRNEALKHLRHVDVERRSAPELAVTGAAVKTPEDEWREQTTADLVHAAIERLPDRRRLIFTMNRFDRLTYAEIARVLEISVKTVETQMGRALTFLRAELAGSLGE